jgi:putative flippase GtrA
MESRSSISSSRSTAIQFGRFFAVGALNTMTDFGMLNLLSSLMGIYGGPNDAAAIGAESQAIRKGK